MDSCGPDLSAKLLAWYDSHHRILPWRTAPADRRAGKRTDPYAVWLSEIMLQQTTVEAVKPYYRTFLERWPTIEHLAAASQDDILRAWAGLGYYSRARNLKKCADVVASQYGGRFPDDAEGLKRLPGIGDYTAAAIASIAFERPVAVVDGNVERVVSRLHAIETPLAAAKPLIRSHTQRITPLERPGDFAQAMMDLGATICTPKRPACIICPVQPDCEAFRSGDPEPFPVKAQKQAKPVRVGAAFVAISADGAVYLQRRAESGLLGGMSEVPTTAWTARQDGEAGVAGAPYPADWLPCGTITHVFTHFELRLSVFRLEDAPALPGLPGWWVQIDRLSEEALPTVMKKAIAAAIPYAFATRRNK
ncbi:A/G-specific adenine glycosylase [Phyllobacterium sp. 0TCS1.6C]|uniref:A/G-specific adenine glycosylase n=1 Tax=unclassified Phyllobacterium TaxID=2638441 RepID=UPI002263DF4C|nr:MULTISPECIES: A/G-specific adenine glycosylase [unclassified Phyllobacterium]MCX8281368.1 A/G-specific adenine glycosylase [Phyllobacterium sp. 0TCS1.6C]MCX8295976.1 A/G-specific adenine glycosylase [Phyllobacterium sp. 0TCS1.6A]